MSVMCDVLRAFVASSNFVITHYICVEGKDVYVYVSCSRGTTNTSDGMLSYPGK